MKKVLNVFLLGVLGLTTVAFAHDDHKPKPSPVCSNASLFGGYGFRIDGDVFKAIDQLGEFGPNTSWDDRDARLKVNPLHLRGISEINFDGQGNFTSEDEIDLNGRPILDFSLKGLTGTYTVNADCTGELVLAFGNYILPFDIDIVVSDDGEVVDGLINKCGGRTGLVELLAVGRKDFKHQRSDRDFECQLNDTSCLFGH